ncbi:MAG TPA: hypothetical protein VG676_15290 [Chitinophagaceae bacterium]|nr:hypothetical protein [Chitinophagaceae bacterium]
MRDIFHLKFGKAKDARELLKEAKGINEKYGFANTRALSDLVTGKSYTLILESEWEDLGSWEAAMKKGLGTEDWQKWYSKFIPLVDSAGREILNIVD